MGSYGKQDKSRRKLCHFKTKKAIFACYAPMQNSKKLKWNEATWSKAESKTKNVKQNYAKKNYLKAKQKVYGVA